MAKQGVELSRLPSDVLINLLREVAFHVRRVDGYWFLAVESKFGVEVATDIDAEVWGRLGRKEAEMVKRVFNVSGQDLSSLALVLRTIYSIFPWVESEIVVETDKELVFAVSHCHPQEARIRMGLPIFPCKRVDLAYFTNLAKAVNPKVRVECLFAPPDERRSNAWCSWRFTLED
ncbi:MAG: DUF6125 family protein [Candidatus Nezhaarchaeota archaeon]|nr:DUF6125 family protein [Candidatus Nezhaarchaeota archaeon]